MIPEVIKQKLSHIDEQDYAAYQALLGVYDFDWFNLIIEQIPKDPYAPPHTGIYRIQAHRNNKKLIDSELDSKIKKIAFRDFLARRFYEASKQICPGIRGTGYSGLITINQPGQAILERNSVILTEKFIEVRCFLGLPAGGRNIKSAIAEKMIFEEMPQIIDETLLKENIDLPNLENHIATAEDSEYLRSQLNANGLIAFISDNSVLPRESGTSDKPMPIDEAVPFSSPPGLAKKFDLPHAGCIKGMGIPEGVTLIVGGGYHGKSTLLQALETGIYNHIPGDGREQCVSLDQTVKIRAYSGRYIVKTDISPFIRNLPFGKDTTSFSTENASGSTSQAAGIVEAIEAGARVLLMDEDTCATNFMIRDSKMQQLVNKKDEPITTFIDKVRQLYLEKQISTILVLGGVGDYFDVSDHVIQMVNYQPKDVTAEAQAISKETMVKRQTEDDLYPFSIPDRLPVSESVSPYNDHGKFSIYAKEVYRINFGKQVIDLTDMEQLMELSQTKALCYALLYAKKYMGGKNSIKEVIRLVNSDIEEKGLDILSDKISGHFARFRDLELALTLNRLRDFDVVQEKAGNM